MRCFYLDPGLRDDVGHHANFCRYITGGLQRRGVEITVFGSVELSHSLQLQCAAQPHFRAFTYAETDGDPISGWLSGFDLFVRITVEDLTRLPPVGASDLVYLSTLRPVQLMAILLWYRSLPEERRPCLAIEGNSVGLLGRRDGEVIRFDLPDPRVEPRPLLFRFIGRRHLHPIPPRLHFLSFDPAEAAALGELTGAPVETAPLPYQALGPVRSRAGAAPIVLACLGHQREDKGYFLLPELASRLLQRHAGIELLIQTVTTGGEGADRTTAALCQLASVEPRLRLDDQPAGAERWPELLGQTDALLCPYRPEPYAASFSSMACEAAANAIPMIVPAGTTLEVLLEACGRPGLAFAGADAETIQAVIEAMLARFDFYAERAYRAALAWPETRGPDRLAAYLIGLTKRTVPS